MNIEEKENAEGNKNKPILKISLSFLIKLKKCCTNTSILNYFDNLSFQQFIYYAWLSLKY